MFFSNLIKGFVSTKTASRKTATTRSFRPTLEGLERRELPSATMLTTEVKNTVISSSILKNLTTVSVNHPTAAYGYTNVSGSLFGPNGPSFEDVKQGQVGDCWLLASLAEVAARDPNDIRNMFTSEGTGLENGVTVSLYKVRFFNSHGVAEYVTVDTELPDGGNYYDQPVNGVMWVALAEKAYAEANGDGYVTTGDDGSDSYAALNGGWPTWALQAITGKSANEYAINPTNIAADWKAGDLIVICTTNPVSSYIVGDHCYAVVNYTASSSMPFEVYNPWGTNAQGYYPGLYDGHQVYGLFVANAAFISQNFTSQGIGEGTSVTHPSTDEGFDAVDSFDSILMNEMNNHGKNAETTANLLFAL